MSSEKSPRILVIRRDNIGDLVCTTPLIAALRRRLPNGWIGALVNSYNAPVLDGNPDLDAVFVYTKTKHRGRESLAGVLWRRLMMMKALRGMRFDDVLIATPVPQPRTVRLAACLRPKQVIGFGDGRGGPKGLDIALPPSATPLSEAEDVFRLATLYGIDGPPPPCRVAAPAGAAKRPDFTIALHISARKPSQRWPTERFVELMRELHARHGARLLLLWSPGATDNRLHPGDDDKARAIVEAVESLEPGFPLNAVPTGTLPQLIGVLAGCHAMICADGGAMHLAAGLGLPIVCLFGNSDATRWRPWGVPYRLLRKPSLDVSDISAEEVAAAFEELHKEWEC
ncbi:MAG: glycosyltransferase family 9 protein [Candidatus Nitricoxidivorans perseverans]|uniref:Glycosyltransferase family 9 protein n=1 Tax=Candidatus Nitricoxidivorans perseverans TaxID=2975601 RepID=A0AA49FIX9_9PROT|nr:MAG: glycosyltransferase family 9 protein [Candidatus Nitricoxidivorans perseverans]